MAYATRLDDQALESLADLEALVIGAAPAIAMANLYIATSTALANAANNATHAQQQAYIMADAATKRGIEELNRHPAAAAAAHGAVASPSGGCRG